MLPSLPNWLRFYSFLHFVLIGLIACKMPVSSSSPAIIFDKQGHRGCRGLMPENTIPAMLHAIDLGITTLEMDVVVTKDQQVVLSHEPFFNHEITTDANGNAIEEAAEKGLNIYTMPYTEVVTYDVGIKPHPRFPQQQKFTVIKPLLTALIDSVEQYVRRKALPLIQYNIEIKSQPSTDNKYHPAPAPFVELVMGVIQSKRLGNRTTIQSFDRRPLQYLHQHYPDSKTALLIEENDTTSLNDQISALGFVPTIYSPHYSLVTKERAAQCKHKGMKLIPWTVNNPATIKKLQQLGVDGIITDYPNLFND